jgi:glucose/arabinose dehydrogenase
MTDTARRSPTLNDTTTMKVVRYALLAAILGCGDRSPGVGGPDGNTTDESGFIASGTIRIEPVGGGFTRPVYVTSPAGDARLFVVEQEGLIRLVKDGSVLAQPFLDIRSRVRYDAEQGLLSMAFHPAYRSNGFFLVYFLDRSHHVRIERFRVSANPDIADAGSSLPILSLIKPGWEHNGGLVKFGPDGMLYIGTGDGGNSPKLSTNGQNPNSLLGKLLRLDVNGAAPYSIPPGNAFPGGKNGRPEIWARGLRNPWRYAFDSAADLIYIGDVGQYHREEVDVARSNRSGANFGWNMMEGSVCYFTFGGHGNLWGRVGQAYWGFAKSVGSMPLCRRGSFERPVVDYPHSAIGCAVIGGFVYRGRNIPALAGHYLFSDFCGHWVRSFKYSNGAATEKRERRTIDIGQVVSFGEDAFGEMYIIGDKGVFRLTGLGE